jgi:hypothetical protein
MAATTAVAAAQGNSRRGPMFTPTEDLLICKSFVRASEDGTVGTDQKSSDFKIKMFEVYVRLLTEHNREFGSNYPFRQGHSNYQRFKRISRFVLKYIGVEEISGDPPSGDTEKIEWLKQVKETFLQRNPDGKNLLENVLFCKPFLEESPKWRAFEEGNDENAKRPVRPAGTKKQKQMKEDAELVKKITGQSDEAKAKDKDVSKHRKATRQFMNQIATGMSAFATVLSEQNDMRLLESMTPSTRNEMATQMWKLKMKKLRATVPTMALVQPSQDTSEEDQNSMPQYDVEEEQEEQETRIDEDNEGIEVVEVVEEELDNEDTDEEMERLSRACRQQYDDSPGDNRVRSPGGTLRLPIELQRRYENQKRQRLQQQQQARRSSGQKRNYNQQCEDNFNDSDNDSD